MQLPQSKNIASQDKDGTCCFCQRLDTHYEVVQSDREELARLARKCVVDDEHFGFFIDAVDSQKFGIPTTASQAKCLSGMRRIKQKLTGVQLVNNDGLLLFRTLPDVKTGGNLTLTIVGMLQNKRYCGADTNIAVPWDRCCSRALHMPSHANA